MTMDTPRFGTIHIPTGRVEISNYTFTHEIEVEIRSGGALILRSCRFDDKACLRVNDGGKYIVSGCYFARDLEVAGPKTAALGSGLLHNVMMADVIHSGQLGQITGNICKGKWRQKDSPQ